MSARRRPRERHPALFQKNYSGKLDWAASVSRSFSRDAERGPGRRAPLRSFLAPRRG